jgi:AbrB family looped-hinge helix DNA binding protein
MNGPTTITTKGQVTIPEVVRQALQIQIGDKVSFSKIQPTRKEAVIKIIPADIVNGLFGSLSTKVKQPHFKKIRNEVGKLLLKKYQVE